VNNSITTASDGDQGIYQCLVEASFTTTTNRAGLPPMTSLVTTTFVDVFCKCVCGCVVCVHCGLVHYQ